MSRKITQDEWNYWYDLVYGYFYRRVNSRADADDLTSETVSDFLMQLEKVKNPKAFVFGVAKNKLHKFIRRKVSYPTTVALDYIDESALFDQAEYFYSEHYNEKISLLKQCIKKQLNKRDQKIIDLCITCEFSSQNVAKQLQITSVNVRQRLSRSVRKLKKKCKDIFIK